MSSCFIAFERRAWPNLGFLSHQELHRGVKIHFVQASTWKSNQRQSTLLKSILNVHKSLWNPSSVPHNQHPCGRDWDGAVIFDVVLFRFVLLVQTCSNVLTTKDESQPDNWEESEKRNFLFGRWNELCNYRSLKDIQRAAGRFQFWRGGRT